MIFNGCYFHQIKYELNMLLEYQNKYNCKSTSWIQLIDIIFLFGQGMRQGKRLFLNFCNNCCKSKEKQSTKKCTYSYSISIVNLNVTVKVEKNGTLSTTFFAKTTISYHNSRRNLNNLFTQSKHYQSHNLLEFAWCVLSHQRHANIFINVFYNKRIQEASFVKN